MREPKGHTARLVVSRIPNGAYEFGGEASESCRVCVDFGELAVFDIRQEGIREFGVWVIT
jgi:hypothetical protein